MGFPSRRPCRVLNVSTSGYYEWRNRPASTRAREQAHLMETIRQVHAASYGHRRVHAELFLGHGHGVQVSHGRVERLMRHTGLQGVRRRRRRLRGCTPVVIRPRHRRMTWSNGGSIPPDRTGSTSRT